MLTNSKNIIRHLLVVSGLLVILLFVYATLRTVIFTSFEKIERQQAVEAISGCQAAFASETVRLSSLCNNWAHWDDAYRYVKGENPSFIQSNVSNVIFEGDHFNLACLALKEGKILSADSFDLEAREVFKFKDLSGERIQGDFLKMLRLPSPESKLSEILLTEKGPFIVISNPILTTHGEGPVYGVIMMGRLVDRSLVDDLSKKIGCDIQLETPYKDGDAPPPGVELVAHGSETFGLTKLSAEYLKASWTCRDINGKPAFTISIKFRRDITIQGLATIWQAMVILAGLGMIFTVIVNLAMAKYILREGAAGRQGLSTGHKLLVAVIILVGFSMSVIMFYVFKKNEESIQFKDFERNEAGPVVARIQQKLDSIESNIDSIDRFYNSDEEITRDEFLSFTGHMLERNKHIRAFDWVPLVLRNEREEYERKASAELKREFYFTEKSPDGQMARTGERDEYFPVYYFEPRTGNEKSAGFDNYSEVSRKAVLDKARSSGERELAVNLSLVQEKVKKAGFLYFQPVYKSMKPLSSAEERRENIKGFIVAVFHMEDLVDSVLTDLNRVNMLLKIAELDNAGKEKAVIYSNGPCPAAMHENNGFVRKFEFGGRILAASCRPTAEYIAGQTGKTPYYVMAIGLLLTVILAMVVYLHIQKTLKESEKQYRLLFDEMMSGFALHEIVCDSNGIPVDYKFLAVNQAFEKLTGLKAVDIIGRRVLEVLPNTEKEWIEKYGRVAATGEDIQFENYSAAMGRYFEVRAFASGKGRFAVIFNDITERKRNEEALLKAAREWRSTFDAVSDVLWLLDGEHRIVRCNKATLKFLGRDFKDIIGRHCWEVVHGADRTIMECPILKMRKSMQSETQELKIGDKWYFVKVDPIFDEDRKITGAVHLVSDITDRKLNEEEKFKLEEQLHHSQKMESIGRLAGGVAHDFNNLLTPILGYAQVLRMDMPLDDPRRKHIDEITSAAERAKTLTRQLLASGRKQMLELKVVDPGRIIVSFEKMLRRTIREDIAIELDIPTDVGHVKIDIGQFEQVLLNLAVNAQDAMPKGGILRFSLGKAYLDVSSPGDFEKISAGDYVCLSVKDSGHGMDKAVLDHLFEPFFTTKEMGKGTGLGLSMIYGIIRQLSGTVKVSSELGKGTEFKIYLPVARDDDAQVSMAGSVMAPQPSKGNEVIMIVEDNEMVRNIAGLLLSTLGYRTLIFKSSEECIRFVEKNTDHVDLLLTDVIMPSINGKELYDRIHLMRPEIKVLYMSGYDRDLIGQHGVLAKGINFLQKPFTAESLAAKVRETLES